MPDDWISPWWQSVCLPDKWDVAGFILPPLTVWHTFALENNGNKYVCGGIPTIEDATSLVLIARLDMAQYKKLISDQVVFEKQLARVSRAVSKCDTKILIRGINEYIEACLRVSTRWSKGDEKPCAVPYQFHIVARLASNDPTGADIWNMQYTYAMCLYNAHAEQNGDTSLLSIKAQKVDDEWPQ